MMEVPARRMAAWLWLGLVAVVRLSAADLEALPADSDEHFAPVPVWRLVGVPGSDWLDLGRPQFGCSHTSLSVRLSLIRHSGLRLQDGRRWLSVEDGCRGSVQTLGSWLLLKVPYTSCHVELQTSNGTRYLQLKVRYFDHLLQANVTAVAACEDPAVSAYPPAPLVRCRATEVTVKLPLGSSLKRVKALDQGHVVGTPLATSTPHAQLVQISTAADTDSFLEVIYGDSTGQMLSVLAACLKEGLVTGRKRQRRDLLKTHIKDLWEYGHLPGQKYYFQHPHEFIHPGSHSNSSQCKNLTPSPDCDDVSPSPLPFCDDVTPSPLPFCDDMSPSPLPFCDEVTISPRPKLTIMPPDPTTMNDVLICIYIHVTTRLGNVGGVFTTLFSVSTFTSFSADVGGTTVGVTGSSRASAGCVSEGDCSGVVGVIQSVVTVKAIVPSCAEISVALGKNFAVSGSVRLGCLQSEFGTVPVVFVCAGVSGVLDGTFDVGPSNGRCFPTILAGDESLLNSLNAALPSLCFSQTLFGTIGSQFETYFGSLNNSHPCNNISSSCFSWDGSFSDLTQSFCGELDSFGLDESSFNKSLSNETCLDLNAPHCSAQNLIDEASNVSCGCFCSGGNYCKGGFPDYSNDSCCHTNCLDSGISSWSCSLPCSCCGVSNGFYDCVCNTKPTDCSSESCSNHSKKLDFTCLGLSTNPFACDDCNFSDVCKSIFAFNSFCGVSDGASGCNVSLLACLNNLCCNSLFNAACCDLLNCSGQSVPCRFVSSSSFNVSTPGGLSDGNTNVAFLGCAYGGTRSFLNTTTTPEPTTTSSPPTTTVTPEPTTTSSPPTTTVTPEPTTTSSPPTTTVTPEPTTTSSPPTTNVTPEPTTTSSPPTTTVTPEPTTTSSPPTTTVTPEPTTTSSPPTTTVTPEPTTTSSPPTTTVTPEPTTTSTPPTTTVTPEPTTTSTPPTTTVTPEPTTTSTPPTTTVTPEPTTTSSPPTTTVTPEPTTTSTPPTTTVTPEPTTTSTPPTTTVTPEPTTTSTPPTTTVTPEPTTTSTPPTTTVTPEPTTTSSPPTTTATPEPTTTSSSPTTTVTPKPTTTSSPPTTTVTAEPTTTSSPPTTTVTPEPTTTSSPPTTTVTPEPTTTSSPPTTTVTPEPTTTSSPPTTTVTPERTTTSTQPTTTTTPPLPTTSTTTPTTKAPNDDFVTICFVFRILTRLVIFGDVITSVFSVANITSFSADGGMADLGSSTFGVTGFSQAITAPTPSCIGGSSGLVTVFQSVVNVKVTVPTGGVIVDATEDAFTVGGFFRFGCLQTEAGSVPALFICPGVGGVIDDFSGGLGGFQTSGSLFGSCFSINLTAGQSSSDINTGSSCFNFRQSVSGTNGALFNTTSGSLNSNISDCFGGRVLSGLNGSCSGVSECRFGVGRSCLINRNATGCSQSVCLGLNRNNNTDEASSVPCGSFGLEGNHCDGGSGDCGSLVPVSCCNTSCLDSDTFCNISSESSGTPGSCCGVSNDFCGSCGNTSLTDCSTEACSSSGRGFRTCSSDDSFTLNGSCCSNGTRCSGVNAHCSGVANSSGVSGRNACCDLSNGILVGGSRCNKSLANCTSKGLCSNGSCLGLNSSSCGLLNNCSILDCPCSNASLTDCSHTCSDAAGCCASSNASVTNCTSNAAYCGSSGVGGASNMKFPDCSNCTSCNISACDTSCCGVPNRLGVDLSAFSGLATPCCDASLAASPSHDTVGGDGLCFGSCGVCSGFTNATVGGCSHWDRLTCCFLRSAFSVPSCSGNGTSPTKGRHHKHPHHHQHHHQHHSVKRVKGPFHF